MVATSLRLASTHCGAVFLRPAVPDMDAFERVWGGSNKRRYSGNSNLSSRYYQGLHGCAAPRGVLSLGQRRGCADTVCRDWRRCGVCIWMQCG
eukprot:2957396-Rhodomonas_salina.2